MTSMRDVVAKIHDPVERVLVLVDDKCFQGASPLRVHSADFIYQTLSLEVGKMTNATFHIALDAWVGASSDVFEQQFGRCLLHEARDEYAQISGEVRRKLGISTQAACPRKRGIEMLPLSINLRSSGHFTLAKAFAARSSRVDTLASCDVPVSIARR